MLNAFVSDPQGTLEIKNLQPSVFDGERIYLCYSDRMYKVQTLLADKIIEKFDDLSTASKRFAELAAAISL